MRLVPVALCVVLLAGCGGKERQVDVPSAPVTIVVTSAAFVDQGEIPQRYTCDGQDLSPPLRFGTPPSGTTELALLVEDPDAPSGTFVHWVAWGIDPGSASLAEGESPPGAGTNGFGRRGYGGPCPPKGPPHRYVFTIYALSGRLDLRQGATADDLKRAIDPLLIAQGSLVGRYARA